MTRRFLAVTLFLSVAAVGQQPSADVPGDAVVATLNGKSFTAEKIKSMVAGMPSQFQRVFQQDPKQFLRDHAWLMMLEDYALKNKLNERSPLREQLEFQAMYLLAQAAYTHASLAPEVSPEEVQTFYKTNEETFREANVRMIYIPFSDPKAEEEAKAKAEALAKRAKAGEDFAKLVKENSGDSQSADNGGDPGFAVRMNSSQPPPPMRRAILALKKGEVTDALRHENGYYVFRVESTDVLPLEKVRDDIYKTIQDMKFRDWERKAKSQATVQFHNEVFFQNAVKEK